MTFGVYILANIVNVLFAAGAWCFPLRDSGPQYDNGWGQPIRLRHLYAARRGLHLQINPDGKVDGSVLQSANSLMEVVPVDTGFVVIKGVVTSHYLCMDQSGKLYGSSTYVKDSCSFEERVLPNGYNIYISDKHGMAVTLCSSSQRRQDQERLPSSLSHFLPMVSTLSLDPVNIQQAEPEESVNTEQGPLDSMDPFGKPSWVFMHSPSFQ
ncbi:fibroblast growth factor 19 [Paramormyrops kingsleyae]|uniref:Fibroblast growth factor n=1 Tax=Paramormyrops kingsleyae TaxID=1676925 RepID=A0A3B3RTF1_9TELE|nr:fibroblast growth factor 19 [Paramormyrops kingsleyae]